jgi:hypothetical protein
MARVAKEHAKELPNCIKLVEESYKYMRNNYDLYNSFRRFYFDTTLTESSLAVLNDLQKPAIEANTGESYISRLSGEFEKQEPSIIVTPAPGKKPSKELLQFIEDHLRYMFCDANKKFFEYEIYREQLSGGFSAMELFTDYNGAISFEQDCHMRKCFDPTLVGFDPLARLPHKGDGSYIFQWFPKLKSEVEKEFDIDLSHFKFSKPDPNGFNWTYESEGGNREIVIVCDFYKKKKEKFKIVKLSDGRTVRLSDYEKEIASWDMYNPRQAPTIKAERWTSKDRICRYRFIVDQMLEYKETIFSKFNLIFGAGNGMTLRKSTNGASYELMRPFLYHTKGAQQLKNISVQTLANQIEYVTPIKLTVAEETLPTNEQWLDAYNDMQRPDPLIWKSRSDDDPETPLPPPTSLPRQPCPPEVMAGIDLSDRMFQTILGSYDAAIGINGNDISGKAIIEGGSASNASSMPFIVGFLQMMTRAAEVYVDTLPALINEQRVMPVMDKKGNTQYVTVGGEQIPIDYEEGDILVNVTAGVNFSVQKRAALAAITAIMKMSPPFAQFIAERGIPTLFENMDFRGSDQLKEEAMEWMQEQRQIKQMQIQAAQQQQQNNPLVQKMAIEQQKMQQQAQQEAGRQQLQSQEIQKDLLLADKQLQLQRERDETDRQIQASKVAVEFGKHEHNKTKEMIHAYHKLHEAETKRMAVQTKTKDSGSNQ